MEDARGAWKDVGEKVESLGLKLKFHIEQEQDAAVAERAEGDTKAAFEALSGQVNDAFDAFGNAARDQAVQSDVREIAELIKEALVETFRAVGAEIEDMMEQIEDYAEDAAEKLTDAVSGGDDGDDGDDGDAAAIEVDADGPIILDSDVQDTIDP